MGEQFNFWGEKQKKGKFENIQGPEVRIRDTRLYVSFLVTKDNEDQVKISFIFDLSKGEDQKPEIRKTIKRSYHRVFTNQASMIEASEIEPIYFKEVLRTAYAVFREKYKEYQDKLKRRSIQPKLPLE